MSKQILSKLSIKTAVGDTKQFKAFEKQTPVLRVIGLVRAKETGTTTYGDFVRFKGEFHATNLLTGEASVSAVCFLPSPVDQMLADVLNGRAEGDKNPVEFGFDIDVLPDPATEVGYQYRVRTLVEAKQSDPMEDLMAKLNSAAPLAIAAPVIKSDAQADKATDPPAADAAPAEAPKGKGKGSAK